LKIPDAIAIDGPVASGKTAVGRGIARKLGMRFLDTGVMYRAITWIALDRDLDIGDEDQLSTLAELVTMTLVAGDSEDRLLLDELDVTDHLRDAMVERHVSAVSAVARVRVALVERQRDIARQGPVVMVGRDIGTVVLPNADFKAFLDASVNVRALRRHLETVAEGLESNLEQVKADLARRDKLDTERDNSPLRAAEDAAMINTDDLGLEEVITKMLKLMESSK
jgi:cytidylate kinase